MIDAARRRGFKSDAGDGVAKDAQHTNQLESSQGENPDPTSRILSLPANRGFASPWSASRPPTARRGRQIIMQGRDRPTRRDRA